MRHLLGPPWQPSGEFLTEPYDTEDAQSRSARQRAAGGPAELISSNQHVGVSKAFIDGTTAFQVFVLLVVEARGQGGPALHERCSCFDSPEVDLWV